MRSSRTAIRGRDSKGKQRAGTMVEYVMMIALIAVLVSASVLLVATELSGP